MTAYLTVRPAPKAATPSDKTGSAGVKAPVDTPSDDNWADEFPTSKPADPAQRQGAGASSDNTNWADGFPTSRPTQPQFPARSFTGGDAAAIGALDQLTFGTAPAIAGAYSAGQGALPDSDQAAQDAINSPAPEGAAGFPVVQAVAGLVRLLKGSKGAQAAYNTARQSVLNDQQNAQAQHPYAFLGGQAGGALGLGAAGSLLGTAMALPKAGPIIGAALSGGANTAAYDAGKALSADKSAGDIGTAALWGLPTGAAWGLGGGLVGSGLGLVGRAAGASLRHSLGNDNIEAAVRVSKALKDDQRVAGNPLNQQAKDTAWLTGTPMGLVDEGSRATQRLARAASNISPEAEVHLRDLVEPRYAQQSERFAGLLRDMSPYGDMSVREGQESIRNASRMASAPAYRRAYAAGDRDIWSPTLEQLSSAPAILDAMRGAETKWKNWQVLDGYGAANPPVKVSNGGTMRFNGAGLRTFPNIQYWDYVARHIQGQAGEAVRKGNNTDAKLLSGLAAKLKSELDREVPEYKEAREVFAGFGGAGHALEAGEEFARQQRLPMYELKSSLNRMTADQRSLFEHGFMDALADDFLQKGDRRDALLNYFISSATGRKKLASVLGEERSNLFEAQVRVEKVAQRSYRAVTGNSTTAQQHHDIGAGAFVAALESAKHLGSLPTLGLVGLTNALRQYSGHIKEETAAEIGKLLSQGDRSSLDRAAKIIARHESAMNVLRRFTSTGSRIAAENLGPAGTAAMVRVLLDQVRSGSDHKADSDFWPAADTTPH